MPDVTIHIGETNEVVWQGLRMNNEYIDDAIVTYQLIDPEADEEDNIIAEGDLEYVEESEGDYVGVIEHDVDLEESKTYHLFVTAERGTIGQADYRRGLRKRIAEAQYHNA